MNYGTIVYRVVVRKLDLTLNGNITHVFETRNSLETMGLLARFGLIALKKLGFSAKLAGSRRTRRVLLFGVEGSWIATILLGVALLGLTVSVFRSSFRSISVRTISNFTITNGSVNAYRGYYNRSGKPRLTILSWNTHASPVYDIMNTLAPLGVK